MTRSCIVFDLIGVLAEPSWRDFVVYADEDKWDRFKAGGMDEREFWPDPRDAQAYRRSLAFRDDHLRLVTRLKDRGFLVAIASNFRREWLDHLLDREGLTETFDVIVTSSDAGRSKPDPAFWNVVKERLHAKGWANTAVVVDDSFANCTSARDAGFAPVWAHPACHVEQEIDMALGIATA